MFEGEDSAGVLFPFPKHSLLMDVFMIWICQYKKIRFIPIRPIQMVQQN